MAIARTDRTSKNNSSKAAHGTSAAVVPAGHSPRPSPHHKPLWPLEGGDVAGLVATSAATALAAGGGMGGGSLLVPIYILVLGFPMGGAVALSNVTIFGGALVNAAFNFGARHPFKAAPLIDWDLALVMEPSTILGALAGTYINHVLPSWVTTLALSALLGFLTSKLLQRGSACYAKESAQLSQEGPAQQATVPASEVSSSSGGGSRVPSTGSGRGRASRPRHMGSGSWGGVATPGSRGGRLDFLQRRQQHGRLQQQQQQQHHSLSWASSDTSLRASLSTPHSFNGPLQQPVRGASSTAGPADQEGSKAGWVLDVPLGKFGVLLGLLAGVAATDTLRSHLPCPSPAYWLAAGSMAPVTLLVLAGVRHHLLTQQPQHAKQRQQPTASAHEMGSPLLSSSSSTASLQGAPAADVDGVVWNEETTVVYPAVCTFVGILAGMFGVGGGIIKAPLMLELGVNPAVASATSATMILFTSAAASVASASFGAVQWDYAAALFSCALLSTAIGQLATKHLVRQLGGRSSVIVYAMAAVLGASAVVLGVQGGMVTSEAFDQHIVWLWGSVCGTAPL
ncbi:hypothetical protein N2152v2_005618 [Parachlorella kessleri]